ncbi:unnamed protein product, partial [marine sediment metagenome]
RYDYDLGFVDFDIIKFDGVNSHIVATETWVDDKYGKTVGTLYWSCAGVHFDAIEPSGMLVVKNLAGYIYMEQDGVSLVANVDLLNGATITKVVVYGNAAASAESWSLGRMLLTTGTRTLLADGFINTEDDSITDPVVDNSLYAYQIRTTSLDQDDQVNGARITYTL